MSREAVVEARARWQRLRAKPAVLQDSEARHLVQVDLPRLWTYIDERHEEIEDLRAQVVFYRGLTRQALQGKISDRRRVRR